MGRREDDVDTAKGFPEGCLDRVSRALRIDVGCRQHHLACFEQEPGLVSEKVCTGTQRGLAVGARLRHRDRQHTIERAIQLCDINGNDIHSEGSSSEIAFATALATVGSTSSVK